MLLLLFEQQELGFRIVIRRWRSPKRTTTNDDDCDDPSSSFIFHKLRRHSIKIPRCEAQIVSASYFLEWNKSYKRIRSCYCFVCPPNPLNVACWNACVNARRVTNYTLISSSYGFSLSFSLFDLLKNSIVIFVVSMLSCSLSLLFLLSSVLPFNSHGVSFDDKLMTYSGEKNKFHFFSGCNLIRMQHITQQMPSSYVVIVNCAFCGTIVMHHFYSINIFQIDSFIKKLKIKTQGNQTQCHSLISSTIF